jgi:hypothetical protein
LVLLLVLLLASLAVAGSSRGMNTPPPKVSLEIAVQLGSGVGSPGSLTAAVAAAGQTTDCSGTCDLQIPAGAQVTVTARASVGYAFDHWSNPSLCSAPQSQPCSFSMPGADAELAVVARPQTDALQVVAGSASTISGGSGSIDCTRTADGALNGSCGAEFPTGTTVQLKVTPAPHRRFVRWSIWQCGTRRTCNVPLLADTTVTALMTPVHLTVDRYGPDGEITSQPSRLDCTASCQRTSANFPLGTTVTLTANPSATVPFGQWGSPCGGPAPTCTLAMFADATVSGTFGTGGVPLAPQAQSSASAPVQATAASCGPGSVGSYSFSITVSGRGRVTYTVPGGCRTRLCSPGCRDYGYAQWENVHLAATAARGHRFVRWTNGCRHHKAKCSLPVVAYGWVKAWFRRGGHRRR